MEKGRLFVISGPSGVGKSSIYNNIESEFYFSISMTTREPREGEVEGKDYLFVTREVFEQTIADDGFLEYADVFGNYYGTPLAPALEQMEAGRNVLLDIDVQGGLNVMKVYPEATYIFILPPTLATLRERIMKRGSETPETMERRLSKALWELQFCTQYDFCVVNDDLELAIDDVDAIIKYGEPIREVDAEARLEKYKEEEI